MRLQRRLFEEKLCLHSFNSLLNLGLRVPPSIIVTDYYHSLWSNPTVIPLIFTCKCCNHRLCHYWTVCEDSQHYCVNRNFIHQAILTFNGFQIWSSPVRNQIFVIESSPSGVGCLHKSTALCENARPRGSYHLSLASIVKLHIEYAKS